MSEEIEFNFPERNKEPDTSGLLPHPGQDLLEWLKRCVTEQGGALVNAVCRPRKVDYSSIKADFQGQTCSCGEDALALIPYQTKDGADAEAKVCLVCDGGAAWPRLATPPLDEDREPPPFG